MVTSSQSERKHVFISYSHTDKEWLERLQVHLKPLEREGTIKFWSDTKIEGGFDWRKEIREAVKEAKVAVLLISADFLASEFIVNDELPPLLVAADKEAAVILPVIISYSRFEQTESLSRFQAINSPNEPLIDMKKGDQEKVFNKVAMTIDGILRGKVVHKETEIGFATIEEIRSEEQGKMKTSRKSKPIPEERIIPLRCNPMTLSKDDVQIMLVEKDFYNVKLNPNGNGFTNNYEKQHNGKVVFDHASGLMWQQNGSDNYMNYKKAQAYIEALNRQRFAGYTDWRLPTLEEAMSLMEPTKKSGDLFINPEFDNKQGWIWTCDSKQGIFFSSAWVVNFYDGNGYYDIDDSYVRAVR